MYEHGLASPGNFDYMYLGLKLVHFDIFFFFYFYGKFPSCIDVCSIFSYVKVINKYSMALQKNSKEKSNSLGLR